MTTTDRTTTTAVETERNGEIETDSESQSKSDHDRPATVAELTVPAPDFALGDTIAALDDVVFEIERIVAHDPERLMPFVWVSGSERDVLERALRDDSSVAAFDLLADVGDGDTGGDGDEDEGEYLYRMEWGERIEGLVHLLTEENATILAAATANEQWTLRLLVPERAALARTHDVCEQAGLTMDVTRIYALDDGRQGRFGLTDGQREALELAFEHGYYEVPRDVMAKEFAEELGISHQALSERLRRAHGNLVENAVILGSGISGTRS